MAHDVGRFKISADCTSTNINCKCWQSSQHQAPALPSNYAAVVGMWDNQSGRMYPSCWSMPFAAGAQQNKIYLLCMCTQPYINGHARPLTLRARLRHTVSKSHPVEPPGEGPPMSNLSQMPRLWGTQPGLWSCCAMQPTVKQYLISLNNSCQSIKSACLCPSSPSLPAAVSFLFASFRALSWI